jgi:hypothetical protein
LQQTRLSRAQYGGARLLLRQQPHCHVDVQHSAVPVATDNMRAIGDSESVSYIHPLKSMGLRLTLLIPDLDTLDNAA